MLKQVQHNVPGLGEATSVSDAGTGSEVRVVWLRRALATGWILLFATAGLAVAASWDRLVQGLVRAPIPAAPQSSSNLTSPTSPGERAVALARHLLDGGRPEEALGALLAVAPEEPVYPFSLQMRDEARRTLARAKSTVR
jgi:hypothetical protein